MDDDKEAVRSKRIIEKLNVMGKFLADHPGITIQQTIERLIVAEAALATAHADALEEAAQWLEQQGEHGWAPGIRMLITKKRNLLAKKAP